MNEYGPNLGEVHAYAIPQCPMSDTKRVNTVVAREVIEVDNHHRVELKYFWSAEDHMVRVERCEYTEVKDLPIDAVPDVVLEQMMRYRKKE